MAYLSRENRCQLGNDVLRLQHDLTAILTYEPIYWRDNLTVPLTSAVKAQAQQASTMYIAGSTQLPESAHGVIGDIASLPASQRPWFAPLNVAAHQALVANKAFIVDSTTPWAGPGSKPGVTETVVGQRLSRDVSALQRANVAVTATLRHAGQVNGSTCP